MTEKLTETIATIEYDNLIYSSDIALVTSGVIVASGQGELKRGTALAKIPMIRWLYSEQQMLKLIVFYVTILMQPTAM